MELLVGIQEAVAAAGIALLDMLRVGSLPDPDRRPGIESQVDALRRASLDLVQLIEAARE